MGNLRSTAIMKTDIRGFTTRVGTLSESELSVLLSQHKQFISAIAAKHDGSIVKGEGDAFWMTFPSVTAASLAAMEIQEELRFTQSGKSDEDRLAVRAVITLGDVLHQEKDIFGEAVNMAARIESITPADEIYLSHAAWLALNRTEVKTSYVGEFSLKGISEEVSVYKINQGRRTRIVKNQIIVFSDLHNYTLYTASHPVEDVENLLIFHEEVHNQVCEKFGGTVRLFMGDGCFITFTESQAAVAAIEHLINEWEKFTRENQISCPIEISAHKGDLNLFRSYLYGEAINVTARLQVLAGKLSSREESCALISGVVKDEVSGSVWENRLRRVEVPKEISLPKQMEGMYIYELVKQLPELEKLAHKAV